MCSEEEAALLSAKGALRGPAATHYSPLICSLLTAHRSLLTAHCSPLTTYNLLAHRAA
mgnify:CR=1 FL=1